MLAQYEKEVERIKTGVITREELEKVQVQHTPLDDMLGQFRTKMIADGTMASYIDAAFRKISTLFSDCNIDSLAKIRREDRPRLAPIRIASMLGLAKITILLQMQTILHLPMSDDTLAGLPTADAEHRGHRPSAISNPDTS